MKVNIVIKVVIAAILFTILGLVIVSALSKIGIFLSPTAAFALALGPLTAFISAVVKRTDKKDD